MVKIAKFAVGQYTGILKFVIHLILYNFSSYYKYKATKILEICDDCLKRAVGYWQPIEISQRQHKANGS